MALAHLNRWPEAQRALRAGYRQCPHQERFPVELAGVAFQQKNYPQAAAWLRRALRLAPHDDYATNFAATVYFLMGNTDAALKYWNRLRKPTIAALRFDPNLRVHRLVLDRAFVFAPASTLLRPQFAATDTRLRALGLFPAYHIDLSARPDGSFDATFHALERDGFGSTRLQALLSTFGGLPYETIYPSYFNLHRSALNLETLFRWDAQKRRASITASAPLHELPQWRWQITADLRNENWAIRPSFTGPAPVNGSLNLERELVTSTLTGLPHASLQWSTGVQLSHRTFRTVACGTALNKQLVSPGFAIQHLASIRDTLLDIPEHRFTLDTAASSQFSRLWSSPPRLYEKLQGSAPSHWRPLRSKPATPRRTYLRLPAVR
jgi:tetratricopeptide (TPR) repeat protein